MFLIIHCTDDSVSFSVTAKLAVRHTLYIHERQVLSNALWKRLPAFIKKTDGKILKGIVISYNPGTVRYSRLRTLFSIVNTYGVLKNIPLYEVLSEISFMAGGKLPKKQSCIHPQYTP